MNRRAFVKAALGLAAAAAIPVSVAFASRRDTPAPLLDPVPLPDTFRGIPIKYVDPLFEDGDGFDDDSLYLVNEDRPRWQWEFIPPEPKRDVVRVKNIDDSPHSLADLMASAKARLDRNPKGMVFYIPRSRSEELVEAMRE